MKIDVKKVIDETPMAHGAGIFFCPSPECKRPHLVFFDENNKPLLQFVVPETRADGKGFVPELQAAMYRSAVEREDK